MARCAASSHCPHCNQPTVRHQPEPHTWFCSGTYGIPHRQLQGQQPSYQQPSSGAVPDEAVTSQEKALASWRSSKQQRQLIPQGVFPGVLSGMMRQCWGEPDGLVHAPSHLQKITGDKSTYKEVALKCNDVCVYGREKGSLVLRSFNCHLSEKLT